MSRTLRLLAMLSMLIILLPTPLTANAAPATAADSPGGRAGLIIENAGQWDAGARFQVSGGPGTTYLAKDAIWITLLEPANADPGAATSLEERRPTAARQGANLRLSFVGANPNARLEPYGESETVVSFFYGSDSAKWHADVPVWTGVRYSSLYPGLDLEISAAAGGWSWRLVEKAGASADVSSVRLRVEGGKGLRVEGGSLRVQTAIGEVGLPLLQATDARGAPLALPADGPRLQGQDVTAPFAANVDGVAPADVVSTLAYSTYLGGASTENGDGIAVDENGSAYTTGFTNADDFPTTPGAFQEEAPGPGDAFVAKVNEDGSALVYTTYLGGSGSDTAYDIAVDASGQAYVAGETESSDFPTTPGAYDQTLGVTGEGSDAFVAVLNDTGTALVYSTYVGGASSDRANAIALDGPGRAFIAGDTTSDDYPCSTDAFSNARMGAYDVVVSILSADGSMLEYSTYIGGSGQDSARSVTLDGEGHPCVTGETFSADFPTTAEGYDYVHNGNLDAFVCVFRADLAALRYATFLGGAGDEVASDIAVGSTGMLYACGYTNSNDYPTTVGAFDPTHNGDYDAFVTSFDPDGSGLYYSTFVGTSAPDYFYGIAVDGAGHVYAVGDTENASYPVTPNAYDSTHNGNWDVTVTVLEPDGTSLLYSTYIGGGAPEEGFAIARDDERIYVTGYTESGDYPVSAGAFGATYGGEWDAFVSAIDIRPSTYFWSDTEWWDGLKFWAPQNRYPRMVGDVDGDGDDDVVAFNPASGAWVALSTGSALEKPTNWSSEFGWLQGNRNLRALADVDGDGMDDIIGFRPDEGVSGKVYVALSAGGSFYPADVWLEALVGDATNPRLVGDVDGDGMADLVVVGHMGTVAVWPSTGSGFGTGWEWSVEAGWMSDSRNWVALGDVDGDGDEDLVNFRYGEGVFVALSDGVSFGSRTLWGAWLRFWGPDNRYPRLVGDVTGDGRADIVAWDPDRGGFVGVSTGSAFVKPVQWTTDFAIKPNNYNLHTLGDMNGDDRMDAVCFIYGDGVYVGLSAIE